ncbi:hypothetical protein BASA62_002437 [Batrachochytrium salamandrivorans]|nr:hypothetical protein BASA62_002437 [Batrachochytrium salamandrivorans]
MMAAQAAVLPVAPATDANLVKRTPNGDDETKQSPTTGQSSSASTARLPSRRRTTSPLNDFIRTVSRERFESTGPLYYKRVEVKKLRDAIQKLAEERKGKSPAERTRIDAEIAPLRKELIVSAKQLRKMEERYRKIVERYHDVKDAERLHKFDYIKNKYLSDWV